MKKILLLAWISILSVISRTADASVQTSSSQSSSTEQFAGGGTSTCAVIASVGEGTGTCAAMALYHPDGSSEDNLDVTLASDRLQLNQELTQVQMEKHAAMFAEAVEQMDGRTAKQIQNLMKHARSDFERKMVLDRLSDIYGVTEK